ncbi:5-methylcytosine-specific restriction enzyme subunit McrC [Epilithonimonas hungarica]|uniref:5-methylcytosine restriction system specificity protein McrC n=1 Tax=Epilithonimonas hungarica TaxID=454006 RepID=UPI00277DDD68|nr:hypothetical protein [Epilithonimonas hungarica]MDP9955991.1 5-methylcytosine-specific restriction enzyme subunit McrC [Epilithonimonas hungarica]
MSILKIRENFLSTIHDVNSIVDYESKWKSVIDNWLHDKTEFKLQCDKIDKEINCIEISKQGGKLNLNTSYLIGLDYLNYDLPFMVEPKFEDEKKEYSVDFYSILFKSLPYVKSDEDISDLYFVDFSKPTIEINQKEDFLTPILVIQFLIYLNKICHLGLQKGYYWIDENLDGKVKGKILIKDTIKQNHLNLKYTKTYCRYQEFGINTKENQFLKYTFQFCLNYLNQFKQLNIINDLESTVGFIRTSLEKVKYDSAFRKEIIVKNNPFFAMYKNALQIANLILKRSSFNITNTTSDKVKTYPYWINMSKLFEIHVLKLLRCSFKENVYYQKKYSGRIPDIVLNDNKYKAIIDVKYKAYDNKSIEIEDVRQVAAYARMKSIFHDLELKKNEILDAIIVYPKVSSKNRTLNLEVLYSKKELEYYNIFQLDVELPILR